MKKIYFTLLILSLCLFLRGQHSPIYSQYMNNPLIINPAYAGTKDALSFTGMYRDQWVGFGGAPKTLFFSAHSPLKNKKINLGVNLISDHFGITDQNLIQGIYSYRLYFKKSSLSFGLAVGINMIRNNWNQITTTVSNDIVFANTYSQQNLLQTGFGMYYTSAKFYAGISAPNLIKQNASDYKPSMLMAGYIFDISSDFKIKPSVLVKYINASPIEVDFNTNFYFRQLGLGFSYRTQDACIFMLNWYVNQQFMFGYAYDYTTSKLGTFVSGSHEIVLSYLFGYKVNPVSPRYF